MPKLWEHPFAGAKRNEDYSVLPLRKPAIPNVVLSGPDGGYSNLSFTLAPNKGFFTNGFPVVIPISVINVLQIGGTITLYENVKVPAAQGNVFLQRDSATRYRIWQEGTSLQPNVLRRIDGQAYPLDKTSGPSLVLWAHGSGSRFDVERRTENFVITASTLATRRGFARWKLDNDEIFFGATADMVEILDATKAAAVTGVENAPTGASLADIYLKFRPGVWSFNELIMAGNPAGTPKNMIALLLKVNATASAADDIVGFSNRTGEVANAVDAPGSPAITGAMALTAPLVEIVATDILYQIYDDFEALDSFSHTLFCQYHGEK